jgi:hypothetical protein
LIIEEWTIEDVKEFFGFCFQYLKDSINQKSLETDIVCLVLKNIMGESRSSFTHSFTKFLESSSIKCLNLDQFKMFVDFSCIVRPDFSNYDPKDAWPTVFDDYVDYMREHEFMEVSQEF